MEDANMMDQPMEEEPAFAEQPFFGSAETCSVCGDEADGYHYGVRSCRGCNAFFRRAITYSMKFTCRRGGNCPVDKNARCACRACRLRKCEAVGMDRRAVQPKRDANGGAKGQIGVEDGDPAAQTESPQAAFIGSSLNGYAGELILPTVPASPPPTDNIIHKLYYEYCEQKKRRHAMLCNTLEEMLLVGFENPAAPPKPARPATTDDLSSIFKAQIVLLYEWANKLPEFKQMHPYDKATILRIHIFSFILIEDIFHTVEMKQTDRLVLVNNTYLATNIYSRNQPGESYKVIDAMSGEWINTLIQKCVLPWLRMNITPQEMLACRYFMFFDIGGYKEDASVEMARRALDKLKTDFTKYYEEATGKDNAQQRFSEIVAVVPSIKEAIRYLYSIATEVPDFGIMEDWKKHMNTIFLL